MEHQPRPRLALLMRRATLVVIAFVALLASGRASQPEAAQERHVVLISIDGFAAFHLDNPAIDLPNIRALAAAGTRAASSETVFPSVTHPAHTTLTTGVSPRRHGVVDNRVRDRRTGERFHITNLARDASVRVPTLFDAVHATGRKTAAFFWPETKDDAAIDDNVAEVFTGSEERADAAAVSPALLRELREAGVPIDGFFDFYDDPFTQGASDMALTKAAAHVIVTRRPALTAIHLLVADKVQHEVGPEHYSAATAMTTADACVGLLRKAVEAAGLAEQTTFVITGDHGFITVRDQMNVAPLLREPALEGVVRWEASSWYLFAELLPGFTPDKHAAAFEAVLARLEKTPGIARVIRPESFAELGYPDYDDNIYVPGQYIIAAVPETHLVLEPANPDTTRRRRTRPYHGHGYLPDHPSMYPALVLSGAGIAAGTSLGHVHNIDVAPTIAALLGVDLPDVEGRVLREALRR